MSMTLLLAEAATNQAPVVLNVQGLTPVRGIIGTAPQGGDETVQVYEAIKQTHTEIHRQDPVRYAEDFPLHIRIASVIAFRYDQEA